MQNNSYDDLDNTNEEDSQEVPKDGMLPTVSHSTVRGEIHSKITGNELVNSQSKNQKIENFHQSQNQIDNRIKLAFESENHKKFIQEIKTRKNLRQKKRKKTQQETAILEAYFSQDPEWKRETVKALKTELPELTNDQIYKWGYDKKSLNKKYKTQEKARKTRKTKKTIIGENMPFGKIHISDFNKEVNELCNFCTASTPAQTQDSPATTPIFRPALLTRSGSHAGSLDVEGALPTALSEDFSIVEDDPFFYERRDEAVFYVVINGTSKVAGHRRAGRRGRLFRAPSGFVNVDFYTFKEEAFAEEGDPAFLGELFSED